MPLTAIRATDGTEVESFTLTREEWNAMRLHGVGTYLIKGSNWPAILKRSIRGLQFFAHAPGYRGTKPEPESIPHLQIKAAIVSALRNAGQIAFAEQSGRTPDGKEWRADVLCMKNMGIAFEVQMASQTLETYLARTSCYEQSGIQCIWLVGGFNRFQALGRSLFYQYLANEKKYKARPSIPGLAAVCLEMDEEKNVETMRVVVFPKGIATRISIEEFVVGVVAGRLYFAENEWRWDDL